MLGSVEFSLFILLVIIIAGPLIAERLRIPSLIGLIAGGMIVGPFVFNWVSTDSLLSEFGDVGLLVLMFLAGISFNLRAFFENKSNAILYGLLGFIIPFVLSVTVSMSFSDLSFLAAALVGAMWASNTLVAYPDVVAAGIQNNRAVSAAVSGGVVADLLSLTVLALASSSAIIDIEDQVGVQATNETPSLPIFIGIPLLVAMTIWLLPKIAEWFFVNVGHTRAQRFVFSLAAMAGGAVVASIGGVEGLIGAFLAGLGLNRIVPAESELMQRLDFVGGTLFVPAFLVSIGLSIDPLVLFETETLILASFYTSFVVVGKTTAAVITGRIFKITSNEVGLMASLSVGQAASTLAIAQVGITLGFFGQGVVNASVLAIVICAFITSIGTRFFIRRVPPPAKSAPPLGARVLVDTSGSGGSVDDALAIGGIIARHDDGVLAPYAIPLPGQLDEAKAALSIAEASAAAKGHDSDGIVRIDDTFAAGTLHLIEEREPSVVLLGWEGLTIGRDFVFGNELDAIGDQSPVPIIALRTVGPWQRVVVITGAMGIGWQREDAEIAVEVGTRLAQNNEAPFLILTPDDAAIRGGVRVEDAEVRTDTDPRDFVLNEATDGDLLVAPAYVLQANARIWNWRLKRALAGCSVLIVGGPHRLTVSGKHPTTAREALIGPTTLSPLASEG